MQWYELTKVVHFLGLIALFGAFAISARAGGHLRSATTLTGVRGALVWLDATRAMVNGGLVMMLLSGIIMVGLRWRGAVPFTTVGMITLLLIGAVSAIVNRHLRDVNGALATGDGAPSSDLRAIIMRPLPWTLSLARNTAALGVLLIMTLKTGWTVSIAIVLLLAIIGAVVGRRLAR
jgi:hypothetical protein